MKATPIVVAAAIAALQSMPGWAQDAASKQELARMANNPYAGVISVPLLYDLNFGGGLGSKTQQVLNAQPVIPFGLNSDWMLVTRTIVPLIAQPALEGSSVAHGLGDIQFSAFLSPAMVGRLDWGVGPVFQLRSASNTVLGQGKFRFSHRQHIGPLDLACADCHVNTGGSTSAADRNCGAVAADSVLPRYTLRKDNEFFSLDLGLTYPINLGPRGRLEGMLQVFNVAGSENFKDPVYGSYLFNFDGTVAAGYGDPRQAQVGVRYVF